MKRAMAHVLCRVFEGALALAVIQISCSVGRLLFE